MTFRGVRITRYTSAGEVANGLIVNRTSYLSYAAISRLTIQRLSLGSGDSLVSIKGNHMWRQQRLNRWHATGHSLRVLRLEYLGIEDTQLLELVFGFPLLEKLQLRQIVLSRYAISLRAIQIHVIY